MSSFPIDVSGAPTLIINDEYNDVEREEVKAELQTKLIPISETDAKAIEAARAPTAAPDAANEYIYDEYGTPAGISDCKEARSIADIYREFSRHTKGEMLPYDDGPTPIYVLDEQGAIGADPTIPVISEKVMTEKEARLLKEREIWLELAKNSKRNGITGDQIDTESFLRFSSTRSPPKVEDKKGATGEVRASNDFYGTATSEFESHYIDQVVKAFNPPVSEKTDKYGRHFFLFDNELTQSLVVLVFKVSGRQMVSINNVVIPLSELLGLQSCEESVTKNSKEQADLRPNFGPNNTNLKIKVKNGEVFEMKGVSVSAMTAVLTHLSAKYAPFA